MEKKIVLTGSFLILVSVILGALAAHALKQVLTADLLSSFETAVRYQMYHGLALIALSSISIASSRVKKMSLYFFGIGTLLFSGSIYLLVLGSVIDADLKFLGPITPIGGLILIIGWIFLIVNVIRYKY